MTRSSSTTGSCHIVVLGGGYAGALAALDLARRLRGMARVTLVDAQPWFVERIRLHERAAGGAPARIPYGELLAGTGVEHVQARVTEVELGPRRLRTSGAPLGFDRLLLTAGSEPAAPVPGAREHAHALASDQAALALWDAIRRATPGGRIAIVGGGLTAIELAFELAHVDTGLEVALVAPALDPGLGPTAQALLERRAQAARITRVEDRAVEVTPDGVVLEHGMLPAAITVWAAGFRASPLGAAAGLEVGEADRVLVDAELRSRSHPEVLVAGDLALPPTRTAAGATSAAALMSCRLALPMAMTAAKNLAAELRGGTPRPFDCRDSLRCLSLGRHDGLIQLMHADGRPQRVRLQGRPAAWVKQAVCRGTVATLRLYRHRARSGR